MAARKNTPQSPAVAAAPATHTIPLASAIAIVAANEAAGFPPPAHLVDQIAAADPADVATLSAKVAAAHDAASPAVTAAPAAETPKED